jgi:uncharacterized repeat protein (TIGR01451 family)
MTLVKSESSNNLIAGQAITYTLAWSYVVPVGVSSGVRITDTIPTGVTYLGNSTEPISLSLGKSGNLFIMNETPFIPLNRPVTDSGSVYWYGTVDCNATTITNQASAVALGMSPVLSNTVFCSVQCASTTPTQSVSITSTRTWTPTTTPDNTPVTFSITPSITPIQSVTTTVTWTWTPTTTPDNTPVTIITPTVSVTPTHTAVVGPRTLVKSASSASLGGGAPITYVISYTAQASASDPMTQLELLDPVDPSTVSFLGASTDPSASITVQNGASGVTFNFPSPLPSSISGSVTWWGQTLCPASSPSTIVDEASMFSDNGLDPDNEINSNEVDTVIQCPTPSPSPTP